MKSINELTLVLNKSTHRSLHVIFKSESTQNGSERRYQGFQIISDDNAIYIGDTGDLTKRPYKIDKRHVKDISSENLCDLTLIKITYENDERYEIFLQDSFIFELE